MSQRTDQLLTTILSSSFKEAMDHLVVVHEFDVNRRVVCLVCRVEIVDNLNPNDLVVVIRDKVVNRWVGLRLPTAKKIAKFLVAKGLLYRGMFRSKL